MWCNRRGLPIGVVRSRERPGRRPRSRIVRTSARAGHRGTRARGYVAMKRVHGLMLAILLGCAASIAQADESVWAALREPGSVVVLRHSYAPGGFDPPTARLDDCSTQRNLDDAGRAQASRVGEAFQRNGISVGTVLSSPRCRCLDTARLAFGRAESFGVLQGALNDEERRQRQLAEIRKVIDAHQSGPPLVLVTHRS